MMLQTNQQQQLQAQAGADARVAVLVDCDNITPDILEFALRVVAKFGRVVLRRGNGICTEHLMLALKQTNIEPYITGAVQAKLS